MSEIIQIHADRRVPELSVFELAVASAISRQVITSDEDLQDILSDWFLRQVRVPDVSLALENMVERGLVRRADDTLCAYGLTSDGINAVTTLYGGCIRMIDRGLGLLDPTMILSLLNLTKESGHA
jgi:hypothetical protein